MLSTDSSPVPITPDYGAPKVCYADGVFDSRFNRYVTVREGAILKANLGPFNIMFGLYNIKKKTEQFSNFLFPILIDQREDSLNPTTAIVAIDLSQQNSQGENSQRRI